MTHGPDQPLCFFQQEHYVTGVQEQSSLTFVSPRIGFITVGDDSGVVWAIKPQPPDDPRVIPLGCDPRLQGLEGAHYNPRTGRLRVLSEDKAKVWELELAEVDGKALLSNPVRMGTLPRLGHRKNKGYEGLDLLPADLSPDGREWQLGIHERHPRKMVFCDPTTLRRHGKASLPHDVKHLLPDLSDATVSSRGTLLMLTDRGEAFAEFAIELHGAHDWSLRSLGVTRIETTALPLAGASRLQPEGICFDDQGDLWIACEGNSLLIRFAASPGVT